MDGDSFSPCAPAGKLDPIFEKKDIVLNPPQLKKTPTTMSSQRKATKNESSIDRTETQAYQKAVAITSVSGRQRRTKMSMHVLNLCVILLLLCIASTQQYISSKELSSYSSTTYKSKKKGNATTFAPRKPLFILHIGPPKTGTTTLQCYLGLQYQKLVSQDNFHYLGTWYAPLCGLPLNYTVSGLQDVPRPVLLTSCYSKHSALPVDETASPYSCNTDEFIRRWDHFASIIQSHYKMGHNIIMSDEMFHHHFDLSDVQRLEKVLRQNKWNVRILYTYRHFHSSVPSMYRQRNDPYATGSGMPFAQQKNIWPGKDGGYKIQSFRKDNYLFVRDEVRRFMYWVKVFGRVDVFNMHSTAEEGDNSNYLPSFLCSMMPEVQFLCKSSKTINPQKSRKDNDSSSKLLRYDMIAVAAYEQGLLQNTSMSRPMIRDAVERYCKSNRWLDIGDFPLDCLSQEEEASFLNESLKQANAMEPYFHQNQNASQLTPLESEIRLGFQLYHERKMFCSIDAETIVQQDIWKTFFSQLEKM